jgi:hypothetical protein
MNGLPTIGDDGKQKKRPIAGKKGLFHFMKQAPISLSFDLRDLRVS